MDQTRITQIRNEETLSQTDLNNLITDAETINALVWAGKNLRNDHMCQFKKGEVVHYRCPAHDACQNRKSGAMFCTNLVNSRKEWLNLYRSSLSTN
jgi:hypothetical protein